MTAPNWRWCWTGSGCLGPVGGVVLANARTIWSATRPTATRVAAGCYAAVASRRGIPHTIHKRDDQKANRARRGSRGGRPPSFDRECYRQRNVIERCVNRLKQWRAVDTRYDKRALNYRAGVVIAALLLWLAG